MNDYDADNWWLCWLVKSDDKDCYIEGDDANESLWCRQLMIMLVGKIGW